VSPSFERRPRTPASSGEGSTRPTSRADGAPDGVGRGPGGGGFRRVRPGRRVLTLAVVVLAAGLAGREVGDLLGRSTPPTRSIGPAPGVVRSVASLDAVVPPVAPAVPWPHPPTAVKGDPPPAVAFAPSDPTAALNRFRPEAGVIAGDLARATAGVRLDEVAEASLEREGRQVDRAAAQTASELARRERDLSLTRQSARRLAEVLYLADTAPASPPSAEAEAAAAAWVTTRRQLGSEEEAVGSAEARLRGLAHRQAELRGRLAVARVALGAARLALSADRAAEERAAALLRLLEAAAPVGRSGIPAVVLGAYRRAATVVDGVDPGCHLEWEDVAALGEIESHNATFGRTRLAENGLTYPPILGPPLDGRNGNAALPAVRTPIYDGGGRWERAVGPLQFLPTTWADLGRLPGGVGDDPNDVVTAAVAAGVYLCRAAGPESLGSVSGLRRAYLRYDDSASYVSEALAVRQAYLTWAADRHRPRG